jgi:hypothetical protein
VAIDSASLSAILKRIWLNLLQKVEAWIQRQIKKIEFIGKD